MSVVRITRHRVRVGPKVSFAYEAMAGRRGPTGRFRMTVPLHDAHGVVQGEQHVICVGHAGLREQAVKFAAQVQAPE